MFLGFDRSWRQCFSKTPARISISPGMPGIKPGNVIRGMSASMGEGVVS